MKVGEATNTFWDIGYAGWWFDLYMGKYLLCMGRCQLYKEAKPNIHREDTEYTWWRYRIYMGKTAFFG